MGPAALLKGIMMPGEIPLKAALAERTHWVLDAPTSTRARPTHDATLLADQSLPGHIQAAVSNALIAGDTHYTDGPGIQSLREAIAAHVSALGYPAEPENIYVTNGSREALYVALQTQVEPGTPIQLVEPVEPGLADLLNFMGLQSERLAGDVERRFIPPADALDDRSGALVLAAPSTVAGLDPERVLLEDLLAQAGAREIPVFIDISHAACRYNGEPPAALDIEPSDRLVLAGSLSISHGLSGWRIGFLVGSPALLERAGQLKLSMSISAPTISQHAALAALTGPVDWIEQRRRRLRSRRDGILVRLGEAGLRAIKPDVYPGLLVDVGELGGGEQVAQRLRDDFKVRVESGACFGTTTASYVRLNLLAPIEAIDAALQALAEMAKEAQSG